MAITRTHTTTIAAVDVDDDGGVVLTVRANRTDTTRITVTTDEARQLANDLTTAAADAADYLTQQETNR